jgi:HSP90 family molecular chaperone
MVADKVEVITRTYKKTPKGVHWVCEGSPEYEIEEYDRKNAEQMSSFISVMTVKNSWKRQG